MVYELRGEEGFGGVLADFGGVGFVVLLLGVETGRAEHD